jgi:hypothetical protein
VLFWWCEYLLGGIATSLPVILIFCLANLLYLTLQIWERRDSHIFFEETDHDDTVGGSNAAYEWN